MNQLEEPIRNAEPPTFHMTLSPSMGLTASVRTNLLSANQANVTHCKNAIEVTPNSMPERTALGSLVRTAGFANSRGTLPITKSVEKNVL